MKVAASTPDRLLIEDRPWFLWLVLYGMGTGALIAVLAGRMEGMAETALVTALGIGSIWAGWYFAPFQRFTFDRTAGTFTHAIRRPTGRQSWEVPLDQIRRAADEGHWSDGSRLERVTLLTKDGRHPLESGYTGTSRAGLIRAINDWLGET